MRERQGKAHVVTIGEDRVIRWEAREYRSLSQVAKAITGTHWSGPAFFGLKKRFAHACSAYIRSQASEDGRQGTKLTMVKLFDVGGVAELEGQRRLSVPET